MILCKLKCQDRFFLGNIDFEIVITELRYDVTQRIQSSKRHASAIIYIIIIIIIIFCHEMVLMQFFCW